MQEMLSRKPPRWAYTVEHSNFTK